MQLIRCEHYSHKKTEQNSSVYLNLIQQRQLVF